MSDTDELDRLFIHLVRAVRDAKPEFLSRPFEVGELLTFVPYRAVRVSVGVETADDYAHAMTRLLAGERGYIFADDLMQDDLRTELGGPNPDLNAYRSYLNARVSLAQEHARQHLEQMTPPIPHESIIDEAPSTPRPIVPRVSAAPRPLDPEAVAPKRPSRLGCKYCGQTLPEGREVLFCPNCGQNLLVRRCAACSAELEPGWKFCVACGRASSP
jgi:predicted RNA-binding Zn-ribbon protein involved in translation (DUF1610 family)